MEITDIKTTKEVIEYMDGCLTAFDNKDMTKSFFIEAMYELIKRLEEIRKAK